MADVKISHLLIFTRQFAAMLKSKLQLVTVLANLARETPQRKLRLAIEDVVDEVNRGVDLGDALDIFPKIFSNIYINLVRAGLMSGRLDEALSHMATYLERTDQVRRKVRSAISYPVFMLLAFFAVFNGMVFFILPRFEQMFKSFGSELPGPTRMMLDVGEFYKSYWPYILGGVGLVVVGMVTWVATPDGRRIVDEYKMKLPIVGPIIRMGALSRFLRTLAVQLANNVQLLEALRLSAMTSGNVYIEEIVLEIAHDVEHGTSIAAAFREYEVFSGIVLQMISSGEEAGTLHELMLSDSDYYDNLLNEQIDSAIGMINPVLTILIGLGIASMMVAAFLPVLNPPTISR